MGDNIVTYISSANNIEWSLSPKSPNRQAPLRQPPRRCLTLSQRTLKKHPWAMDEEVKFGGGALNLSSARLDADPPLKVDTRIGSQRSQTAQELHH